MKRRTLLHCLPRGGAFRGYIATLLIFTFTLWLFHSSPPVQAICEVRDYDNPEEYQKAIEECQEEINARMEAHTRNKEDLQKLEQDLAKTKKLISSAEARLALLEEEIFDREVELGYQREILANRVRRYYIRRFQYSPLLLFLSSASAQSLTRELAYRRITANEDRQVIARIAQDLKKLFDDKEALEKNKAWLTQTKNSVSQQAGFLKEEIGKVEGYFAEVSGKIAELTAKQEALLAARAGTFTTSVGEVPASRIPCSGPPGTPTYCDPGGGTWLAAFSFGAWTHRKGMSQYGAKGRAEAGRNHQEILEAYYGRRSVEKDTGGMIAVTGFGNLDFENYYLLGIAEMPSDWLMEALKAQAIAARSYAYRYKLEGRAICPTQACQVFSSSKANNPPAAWREAVEQTRGQVVEGVTAFYSSTAGGYLTTSGWDTTDGQGGPGFASRAWESKAGSPWFYSSWFTQNYTSGSARCSRSHPWLTEEEMADVLNAWLVLNKQGGDDRILPVTINQCPIGGISGHPYSIAELRDKANSLGGAFTSVRAASVVYSNNGETNSVNFDTNQGPISIAGSEFKQAFNLRAPGYIAIRSPLFNLEKK